MKRPERIDAPPFLPRYEYLFPKWFRVGAVLVVLAMFFLIGLGLILSFINFQTLP